MTEHLKIHSEVVEYYPYRTALVGDVLIDIPLKQSAIDDLHFLLGKMDNHICFKTKDGMCYMYSDRTLRIGKSIIKRNW